MSDRATMQSIAQLVPHGSRVLDLGCGDGALLDHLQRERGCSGYGIEIADDNVLACVKRGVNVIQLNLDEGLSMFDDDSFDVVLQIDTLQHLRNAETMLRRDRARGRSGIVAFPNFAHWPNRLSIVRGRMPVTKRLPYQWYDTPNIRVGTFKDFEVLATKNRLAILDAFGLQDGARGALPAQRHAPAPRSSSSSAGKPAARYAARHEHPDHRRHRFPRRPPRPHPAGRGIRFPGAAPRRAASSRWRWPTAAPPPADLAADPRVRVRARRPARAGRSARDCRPPAPTPCSTWPPPSAANARPTSTWACAATWTPRARCWTAAARWAPAQSSCSPVRWASSATCPASRCPARSPTTRCPRRKAATASRSSSASSWWPTTRARASSRGRSVRLMTVSVRPGRPTARRPASSAA